MFQSGKKLFMGLGLIVSLILGATAVNAGYVLERGQLNGAPAQVNYVAWWDTNIPPNQVLTEDGFNSATGVDQGYVDGVWRLNPSNFSPAPSAGAQINFIFGGLDSSSDGTIWAYSILNHDTENAITDHGLVGVQSPGDCPAMLAGSWDGAQNKVIRWAAPPGTYLIYKSVNPSGASNGNSNGRYQYLATVTTSGPEGSYTDANATVESWHIVIPAATSGNIIGCHSEESNPTAVNLQHLGVVAPAVPWFLGLGSLALAVVSLAWLGQKRQNKTR
jgi:hypothetical protein